MSTKNPPSSKKQPLRKNIKPKRAPVDPQLKTTVEKPEADTNVNTKNEEDNSLGLDDKSFEERLKNNLKPSNREFEKPEPEKTAENETAKQEQKQKKDDFDVNNYTTRDDLVERNKKIKITLDSEDKNLSDIIYDAAPIDLSDFHKKYDESYKKAVDFFVELLREGIATESAFHAVDRALEKDLDLDFNLNSEMFFLITRYYQASKIANFYGLNIDVVLEKMKDYKKVDRQFEKGVSIALSGPYVDDPKKNPWEYAITIVNG